MQLDEQIVEHTLAANSGPEARAVMAMHYANAEMERVRDATLYRRFRWNTVVYLALICGIIAVLIFLG